MKGVHMVASNSKCKCNSRCLVERTNPRNDRKGKGWHTDTMRYCDGSITRRDYFNGTVHYPNGALYKNPNGNRKKIQADSKEEFAQKEKAFLDDLKLQEIKSKEEIQNIQNMTIDGLVKHWLNNKQEQEDQAPGTVVKKKRYYLGDIHKGLGKYKLSELVDSPVIIRKFYQPFAASKQLSIHQVLNPLFQYAIEWELIDDNPIPSNILKGQRKKEKRFKLNNRIHKKRIEFDIEEMKQIVDDVCEYQNGRYSIPILTMILCGNRPAEALAYSREDMDLENRIITCENEVFDVDKKMLKDTAYEHLTNQSVVIEPPKSVAGMRQIPMPKRVAERLMIVSNDMRDRQGLITKTAFGTPMGYDNFYRRHWVPMKTDLGWRKNLTMSDFRDMWVSYHIGFLDTPIELLCAWVGHENPSVTYGTYDHIIKHFKNNPVETNYSREYYETYFD